MPSFNFGAVNMPTTDGDSNYETTTYEAPQDEYYSRCLWFGEHFYKCVLAEGLFSNAAAATRGENLKLEHTLATMGFPFADCIEYIDGIKITKIPSNVYTTLKKPYGLLMTKIGVLLDQDPSTRNKLAVMIQNRSGVSTSASNGATKMPPSPPSSEDLPVDEDQHLPMYSMRLHEWSQRRKKSLDFEDKHISFDPPLWEMTLKVEGLMFTCEAKTRKRAQHLACKQACEELKIDAV